MKWDGHRQSPHDPKHFVRLSPEAITLRNDILTSSSFIAVISTFLNFSTMRKKTWKFELSTVPALTLQPKDVVGLSFFESGHTNTICSLDIISAIKDVNAGSVIQEDIELLHKAKANQGVYYRRWKQKHYCSFCSKSKPNRISTCVWQNPSG